MTQIKRTCDNMIKEEFGWECDDDCEYMRDGICTRQPDEPMHDTVEEELGER